MKPSSKQAFPPGWNKKKVLEVIAHYDRQTEDEAAAEIATAPEAPGETWISVPTELVGLISRLIEDHVHQSPTHSRRRPKTAIVDKARK